jgi:endonuclease/exonuclease/phosphatase family metal-dependent hydrolase
MKTLTSLATTVTKATKPTKATKFIGICLSLALSTGCTSLNQRETKASSSPLSSQRISVMSYNVENLFDTEHDENKEDYTYLPLAAKQQNAEYRRQCEQQTNPWHRKECLETDWNEKLLNKKLSRLAAVIQQVNEGRGPDILILAEVENKNVLEMLRTKYLTHSQYITSELLEGADKRGVDTAILSRLPQWDKARLHTLPLKALTKEGEYSANATRGILEVRLLLPDGQKAAVFALHLPSQQNPAYLRKQAVEYLNVLQNQIKTGIESETEPKLISSEPILTIAGGDFNISSDEDIELGLFSKTLASQWSVSHKIGCKSCEGTHYFHPKREWSFLDALLFSKTIALDGSGKWNLDPLSVQVPHESRFQTNRYGNPARFDDRASIGVSDHWPIYAEIYKSQLSKDSKLAQ